MEARELCDELTGRLPRRIALKRRIEMSTERKSLPVNTDRQFVRDREVNFSMA